MFTAKGIQPKEATDTTAMLVSTLLLVFSAHLLLSASSQFLEPNSTSPVLLPFSNTTPASVEPSVLCYNAPDPSASASFDDCRQLLAIFRLDHPNTFWYRLVHARPANPKEIWCPYSLKQGTCMLTLDFDERIVQRPLVFVGVLNQWGSRLNRLCVRNNKGSGGKITAVNVGGGVALKLMRYM